MQLQQHALDTLAALPTPIARGLIFPSPDGGLLDRHSWRKNEWKDALEASKLAYRAPRQMRHTFATLALAAGTPIEWVSRQLGHTSIKTTLDHYARFLPIVGERNLDVLDAFAAEANADGPKTDPIAEGDEAR